MTIFDEPPGVPGNAEFQRIAGLPRRVLTSDNEDVVQAVTQQCATPDGSMTLFPIQAVALLEIAMHGGLFAPVGVGAGKTLICLLAPYIAGAERPLLLVGGSLVRQMESDMHRLRHHWQIPVDLRIMSYSWIALERNAQAIVRYAPDMIIADEVHTLKNPAAACTARVARYMQAQPQTQFVGLSGTILNRSLRDFAHLLQWSHGANGMPLPHRYTDLSRWCDVLDESTRFQRPCRPGALRKLCSAEELRLYDSGDQKKAVRRAYSRRLIETPGVVATKSLPLKLPIAINAIEWPITPAIEAAFDTLRSRNELPDGWLLEDALAVSRHARELALGFYYVWDPRPPEDWIRARAAWCAYVRQALKHAPMLDTERQVRTAEIERGYGQGYDLLGAMHSMAGGTGKLEKGPATLSQWLGIRDEFVPNSVIQWIDESIAERCAEWCEANNGIVWTAHPKFGRRVAALAGVPYYGQQGLTSNGAAIEDANTAMGFVASIRANGTGKNLQAWHRNLVTTIPSNGMAVEQLLGRTHRTGQKNDSVQFDIVLQCREHGKSFWQAARDAACAEDITQMPQRILTATITFPEEEVLKKRKQQNWQ